MYVLSAFFLEYIFVFMSALKIALATHIWNTKFR